MKRVLLCLTCLLSGFSLSQLLPVSGRPTDSVSLVPSSGLAAAPVKAPVSTRVVPPDSFSLEGNWQPLAQAWAERNPKEFYQWLVERGIPPGKEVLQVLFRAWIRQDVDAAFTAAFNLPGDFQRQSGLLDRMLSQSLATPAGLQSVLKWIPQVEEQINGWTWPGDAWTKSAPPQEIAAVLAGLGKGGFSDSMRSQFATYWARQDMPAAMAWLKDLEPAQQTSAFRGLIKTWSQTDPRSALDYLANEATSSQRFNAHEPLCELAETDPKAALDWWENNIGVPDNNSLPRIFSQWCEKGSIEARDYVLAIEDPVLRRHALEAWSGSIKPRDTLEALAQIPAGPDRQTLLQAITRSYGGSPEETAAIRNLVADPANLDITPAMASSVSQGYAYNEPKAALEWTATLPEPLQAESVRSVVKTWKDKVAAAQAVENLPDGPAKTAAREALK